MKCKCEIIRDLMPLCADDSAAEDSEKIVLSEFRICAPQKQGRYYLCLLLYFRINSGTSEDFKFGIIFPSIFTLGPWAQ